ncbi:hypothetical protein H6G89_22685 [Oscillatoria sp. FACHB-1407]|uniref:hypothetical protein n=1 Tax=Oscillatoria sp. FACHB-1407 TaxID=2692847 RepID=UPI001685D94C|nr:hypothetical protein [Oscillatoria sp. FACHB-1407]MBD2463812.1 hypothetical protein [Oscillatoria sp. FACHB-1407]
MSNQSRHSSTPCASPRRRTLWQRLEKPITGLLFTIALVVSVDGVPRFTAQGAEVPDHLSHPSAESSVEATTQAVMPDGVYLYGQSPEAEQIGSTYVVFEVNRDRIVGAFYMPSSSFDCFQGELRPNQMQLTMAASYDQESYPYTVAVQHNASLANSQGSAVATTTIPGYHSLESVSDNDHTILATCKQHFGDR